MFSKAKQFVQAAQKRWPQSINDALFGDYLPSWQMMEAERCAILLLLDKLRPEISIEVGTAQGGSLSAISKFSKKVYSLDINPCQSLGKQFHNTEFLTGESQKTLPPLLEKLQQLDSSLDFVLIDGEHTRTGVKRDIENLLKYQPSSPLYVVLHDSFNPECRQGILDAGWGNSPYVHFVELDFVPGIFHSRQDIYRQMWGGLALALLLPVKRHKKLELHANQELLFQTVLGHSTSKPVVK